MFVGRNSLRRELAPDPVSHLGEHHGASVPQDRQSSRTAPSPPPTITTSPATSRGAIPRAIHARATARCPHERGKSATTLAKKSPPPHNLPLLATRYNLGIVVSSE